MKLTVQEIAQATGGTARGDASSDQVVASGVVWDSRKVEKIKDIIFDYYDKWKRGELTFDPDRSVIEGFERKALTAELAKVFDKM